MTTWTIPTTMAPLEEDGLVAISPLSPPQPPASILMPPPSELPLGRKRHWQAMSVKKKVPEEKGAEKETYVLEDDV